MLVNNDKIICISEHGVHGKLFLKYCVRRAGLNHSKFIKGREKNTGK